MTVGLGLVPSAAKTFINEAFKGREPWEIVSMTSSSILAAFFLYKIVFQDESIKQRTMKLAFTLARRLPSVREQLNNQLNKLKEELENSVMKRTSGTPYILTLPDNGMSSKMILELVERAVHLGDYDWKNGMVSGCVYRQANEELKLIVKEAYGLAALTNPLHPDVFPGICKMESEIVRISCRLFNGDDDSCGTMTTGGTESILLACKAYRDFAKETRGISRPEMVVPVTAHSAFDKAAQFLKIRVKSVPVDQTSYTVNPEDMRKAITRNTVMLVCSAPNFPYGTMDDVEAISELGLRYKIPVHVDACLGGFLVCFMKSAGYDDLPAFDFSLKGVCSISADTHKYGYAPKGSSLVLYRDKKYLHHQYTITTDWPGGIYGSPSVAGSRAGGIIAACWATMMYFGHDGYVRATKEIIDTAKFIEKELREIKSIFIFGKPATSVIALGSQDFHIYRLSSALNSRGWNLNTLQFPSAVHICVTHVHTQPGVAQRFLDDVKDVLRDILKNPDIPVEGMYAMYGMSQTIPDRSMVGDLTRCFLDSMYFTPSKEEELVFQAKALPN